MYANVWTRPLKPGVRRPIQKLQFFDFYPFMLYFLWNCSKNYGETIGNGYTFERIVFVR